MTPPRKLGEVLAVDVRVVREDVGAAVQAIADTAWNSVGQLRVDLSPPASGPEAEVTVQLTNPVASERDVEHVLRQAGIVLLALRARTWERR